MNDRLKTENGLIEPVSTAPVEGIVERRKQSDVRAISSFIYGTVRKRISKVISVEVNDSTHPQIYPGMEIEIPIIHPFNKFLDREPPLVKVNDLVSITYKKYAQIPQLAEFLIRTFGEEDFEKNNARKEWPIIRKIS